MDKKIQDKTNKSKFGEKTTRREENKQDRRKWLCKDKRKNLDLLIKFISSLLKRRGSKHDKPDSYATNERGMRG